MRIYLDGEVLAAAQRGVGLQDHNIASAGHVLGVQVLNVHADVVTGASRLDLLVVHLDGEDLAGAGGGRGVGGQEDDLITGLDGALLDTASQHITDTLDLEGARQGQTQLGVHGARGQLHHLLEGIEQSVDVDLQRKDGKRKGEKSSTNNASLRYGDDRKGNENRMKRFMFFFFEINKKEQKGKHFRLYDDSKCKHSRVKRLVI